ncbi:MAG TPA: sigma-70 family RNA polymerase sigma factor [Skermanella sp.]|nr:sigma-70 family RNA polymerase sigma factor [Skermanella sp.]
MFPKAPHPGERLKQHRQRQLERLQATSALHDGVRSRFRYMYEEHRSYLHNLSLRWTAGNHAEAEDAVSDVFCRAVDVLSNGNTVVMNERAWLGRMLHNRCVDRHRRRRLEAQEPLDPHQDGEAGDQAEAIGSHLPTPENEVLNRELGIVLKHAVDALPDTLKGPFHMRLVNEESYCAIAERFGLSQANARKRVQQAREILRDRLTGYMNGRG